MSKLKRLHFWVGFIGLVVFLLTGQYMHHVYDHLSEMPNDVRLLFRSGHIYFLLASVINLVLGIYLSKHHSRHKNLLQYLASALLLISPILLLIGFFEEPHLAGLSRPYSRIGLYAFFVSGLIFSYFGFSKSD